MRKINTSAISTTTGLPVKSGTLDHLQLAYQEAIDALMKGLVGMNYNPALVYGLYGVINSGSGSTFTISAGYLFYNGEVFPVDAVTFTVAGGQTAVGTIVTTQNTTNADPVQFTDGVNRNVHDIRKIVFAAATPGSGLVDFGSIAPMPMNLTTQLLSALPSTLTVKFDHDQAIFCVTAPNNTTINFDFTNAIPGCTVRLKWAYGAGKTLTISAPTGAAIINDGGDLSKVASSTNLLYMIYVGQNESANNEVSWTLKQV